MPAKRKYGVIVMVVMLLGLSASLAVAFYKIAGESNKICTELEVFSSTRVIKPANPVAHPGQEVLWKDYINAVALKRKLGC